MRLKFLHEIFYNSQFKKYNSNYLHSYNRTIWVDIPFNIIFPYTKTICFFSCSDGSNIFLVEINGEAVNKRDEKGMKVSCKLNFKGNSKITDIIKNIICKRYFWKNMIGASKRCNSKKCIKFWKTSSNWGDFWP